MKDNKQQPDVATKENDKEKEAEKKREQANRQANFMLVFGEVCWLLTNSKSHQYNCFLADLQWLAVPPVTRGQFKIFHNNNQPVGLAVWAYVSGEIEERLKQGPAKLRNNDWKSGDKLWLIDIIAPYGGAEKMIEVLKESAFKDKEFKYQKFSAKGGREIITVPGK